MNRKKNLTSITFSKGETTLDTSEINSKYLSFPNRKLINSEEMLPMNTPI